MTESRAALLLSGHMRGVCMDNSATNGLLRHIEQCRALFHKCDIFLHTWSTLDAADALKRTNSASVSAQSCVDTLHSKLSFKATVVEQQELGAFVASPKWSNTSRHGSWTYRAAYLNIMGQLAALNMMLHHASAMRVSYDVAVRLRPDIGERRVARVSNVSLDWSVVKAWASAARDGSLLGEDSRALHSCRLDRAVGAPATDNCYWSTPPSILQSVLQPFTDANAFDERSTERRRCHDPVHPESVLRCAVQSAGKLARRMPLAPPIIDGK